MPQWILRNFLSKFKRTWKKHHVMASFRLLTKKVRAWSKVRKRKSVVRSSDQKSKRSQWTMKNPCHAGDAMVRKSIREVSHADDATGQVNWLALSTSNSPRCSEKKSIATLLRPSRDSWVSTWPRKMLIKPNKSIRQLLVMVAMLSQSQESDTSAVSALTLITVTSVRLRKLILIHSLRSDDQKAHPTTLSVLILIKLRLNHQLTHLWDNLKAADLCTRNRLRRRLFIMLDLWKKHSVRSTRSDQVMYSTRLGHSGTKVRLHGLMMLSSLTPMEMTSRLYLNQYLALSTQEIKLTLV